MAAKHPEPGERAVGLLSPVTLELEFYRLSERTGV